MPILHAPINRLALLTLLLLTLPLPAPAAPPEPPDPQLEKLVSQSTYILLATLTDDLGPANPADAADPWHKGTLKGEKTIFLADDMGGNLAGLPIQFVPAESAGHVPRKVGDQGLWLLINSNGKVHADEPGRLRPAADLPAVINILDMQIGKRFDAEAAVLAKIVAADPTLDNPGVSKSVTALKRMLTTFGRFPRENGVDAPYYVRIRQLFATLKVDPGYPIPPLTDADIKQDLAILLKHPFFRRGDPPEPGSEREKSILGVMPTLLAMSTLEIVAGTLTPHGSDDLAKLRTQVQAIPAFKDRPLTTRRELLETSLEMFRTGQIPEK